MDNREKLDQVNTKIAAGFCRVEKHLAGAQIIADLFITLAAQIEKEFQVPFVWFSFSDRAKAFPVFEEITSANALKGRISVIRQDVFSGIFFSGWKPILVNKNLRPYYKLFPPNQKYFVKSLALVPFKINGEFLGSWNNGDVAQNRYSPDMDTTLLQTLSKTFSTQLNRLL